MQCFMNGLGEWLWGGQESELRWAKIETNEISMVMRLPIHTPENILLVCSFRAGVAAGVCLSVRVCLGSMPSNW